MFLSSPETAHGIAAWFFRHDWTLSPIRWHLSVVDERLRVSLPKIDLPNPVGLAAGYDKDCNLARGLFGIGFGYVALGTVTPNPREGNPKQRLWRYPKESLINSMGFPNSGAPTIAANLSKQGKRHRPGPMIISISGLSVDEIVDCYRQMEPFADGLEINISTPNTAGVKAFQDATVLKKLLDAVANVRNSAKPLWLKIPPYFNDTERDNVLALVDRCAMGAIDGLTAANAKPVEEPRAKTGRAGLSGFLIYEDMIRIVSDVYRYTNGKIPINACGGISSGTAAWRAFEVGASSVQLYTALVYEGPGVVSKINRDLLQMLNTSGSKSLKEIVGSGLR